LAAFDLDVRQNGFEDLSPVLRRWVPLEARSPPIDTRLPPPPSPTEVLYEPLEKYLATV